MIVDSSAVVVICPGEPGADRLDALARADDQLRMSAATFVETAAVLDRRSGGSMARRLDRVMELLGVEIVALTPRQARLAREAYRVYVRGSGHRARLSFGDCFSYALAAETGEPLLFVGDDFGYTDIRPALSPT